MSVICIWSHKHCSSGLTTMIMLHANSLISVDEAAKSPCESWLPREYVSSLLFVYRLLHFRTCPPTPKLRFSAVDTLRNDVLHYYNIATLSYAYLYPILLYSSAYAEDHLFQARKLQRAKEKKERKKGYCTILVLIVQTVTTNRIVISVSLMCLSRFTFNNV